MSKHSASELAKADTQPKKRAKATPPAARPQYQLRRTLEGALAFSLSSRPTALLQT